MEKMLRDSNPEEICKLVVYLVDVTWEKNREKHLDISRYPLVISQFAMKNHSKMVMFHAEGALFPWIGDPPESLGQTPHVPPLQRSPAVLPEPK